MKRPTRQIRKALSKGGFEQPKMFIQIAPEADHMPAQVALEMLCAPKARLTNRERKECQRARIKVYESTLKPREYGEAIANRLRPKSWEQLVRWNKRAAVRRMQVQRAWELAREHREKIVAVEAPDDAAKAKKNFQLALMDRTIAALELRGEHFTQLWDALDDEIRRRGPQ